MANQALTSLKTLCDARELARQLREEKSGHPWTNRECALLAQLCEVLGVDQAPAERAR